MSEIAHMTPLSGGAEGDGDPRVHSQPLLWGGSGAAKRRWSREPSTTEQGSRSSVSWNIP